MENCLSKAKFTSAEGCVGTKAQHAQRDRAVCPSLYSWYDWPFLLIWIGPDWAQSSWLAEILY
jgi:hypothetical protein